MIKYLFGEFASTSTTSDNNETLALVGQQPEEESWTQIENTKIIVTRQDVREDHFMDRNRNSLRKTLRVQEPPQFSFPWLLPGEHVLRLVENVGYLKTVFGQSAEAVAAASDQQPQHAQQQQSNNNAATTSSSNNNQYIVQPQQQDGGYFGFGGNNAEFVEVHQVVVGTLVITNYQVRLIYRSPASSNSNNGSNSGSSNSSGEQLSEMGNLFSQLAQSTITNNLDNSFPMVLPTAEAAEPMIGGPFDPSEQRVFTPLGNIQKIEEKYSHGDQSGNSSGASIADGLMRCSGYLCIRCKDLQLIYLLFFQNTTCTTNFIYKALLSVLNNYTPEKFAFEFYKAQVPEITAANQGNAAAQALVDSAVAPAITAAIPRYMQFTSEQLSQGWQVYNFKQEFQRQGVFSAKGEAWRITTLNSSYALCDTYPSLLLVPKHISDEKIRQASAFRSKGRIPVLTWMHPVNGTSITRASQPMSGIYGSRNFLDEELVDGILSTCSGSSTLYIIDCRPKANAVANAVMGKGYENIAYYPRCTLEFMGIDNIHAMSNSLAMLTKLCQKTGDNNWLSALEASGWLKHLNLILAGVSKIVEIIRTKKCPVFVHCSDGWDRTAQLCALSQLLLDPYYRTIQGFQVLIEKEWMSFGHRFADRVGHFRQMNNEVSPIFLQFMDCVFQIWQQFSNQFEFNELFLVTILDSMYSCLFGNFLVNSEKQRHDMELTKRTVSLWTFINSDIERYKNTCYEGASASSFLLAASASSKSPSSPSSNNSTPNNIQLPPPPKQKRTVLIPENSISILSIHFWVGYYFRYKKGLKTKHVNQAKLDLKRLQKENKKIKQQLEDEKQQKKKYEQELATMKKQMQDYKRALKGSGYPPIVEDENQQDGTVVVSKINDDGTSDSQVLGIKHTNPNHKFISNYF